MRPLPKINPNQPITLDVETCDPELKYTAPGFISKVGFVAGIAVAAEEGAWYFPIHHADGENYDEKEVVEWLNEVCSGDTDKIFHNSQYDIGWLSSIGVQLHGKIFDTMLAAPLLDENRFSYQLDNLGKIYCGEGKFEEALNLAVAEKFNKVYTQKKIIRLKEEGVDYEPFLEAKKRVSQLYDIWPDCVKERYTVLGHEASKNGQEKFLLPHKRQADVKGLLWACDAEDMGTYPIQDVVLTRKLYFIFKRELENEGLLSLMGLENELVPSLLEMRLHGVRIDIPKAVELDKKYTAEMEAIQKSIDELCGFPVDINIDDDLIKICDKFDLEYARTPKGNPCFSSEAVPKHEVFEKILALRKFVKARDTYIRGYVFGCTIDGWLHGQYNQLKGDDSGTITGRLSSSSPNMQNMPNPKSSQIGKDIRGLFLPDNENEKWLSMDYSGQEPKMLVNVVLLLDKQRRAISRNGEGGIPGADIARKPEFRSRAADFHSAVAKICVEKECELTHQTPTEDELKAMIKKFRPKAKSIGLGVMYGSGTDRVAEEMTKKGYPMTSMEAKDIRDGIYSGVPFLKFISDKLRDVAQSRGYIKTILGRRGRFNLWECPTWVKDKKIRKEIGTSNYGFKSREEAMIYYRETAHAHPDWELRLPMRAGTYKALNKYIQGSSADQTKMAMVQLYKKGDMTKNVLDIFYRRIPGYEPPKFKTQVHDEINFSITPDEDYKFYQQIMENCLPLEVEAVADPVVCDKWSEAK